MCMYCKFPNKQVFILKVRRWVSCSFEALELICELNSCWNGTVLIDVSPGLESPVGVCGACRLQVLMKFRASNTHGGSWHRMMGQLHIEIQAEYEFQTVCRKLKKQAGRILRLLIFEAWIFSKPNDMGPRFSGRVKGNFVTERENKNEN